MRLCVQQLLSQQKDSNQEESKKLQTEKEAQVKRIQLLTEETAKLKSELARSVLNSLLDNVYVNDGQAGVAFSLKGVFFTYF